ncbi:MAG: tetratricopeptide repeat protein [Pseudomonadota bacterium]
MSSDDRAFTLKPLAFFAALPVVMAPAAAADVTGAMEQARRLLDQREPAAALAQLEPYRQTTAGQADFDYLLALSLMDAGEVGRAELIFERLLTLTPSFHGARLDYARVLVARDQYTKATAQLDRLDASQPPEKARAEIASLRQTIAMRSQDRRWSRYLEASTAVGYDSNVNSATAEEAFLGFALDATSQEQDSDFFEVRLAGGATYAVSESMRMSARLPVQHHIN